MKTTLKIPAILFAATIGANAATIHTGLVNYWALDDLTDSAGSITGNTSTIQDDLTIGGNASGSVTTGVTGLFGNAVDFERTVGTEGRLAATNSADTDFTNSNLTTSLWVQYDDTDSRWQTILASGEGNDYRISLNNNSGNASYAGGTGDLNSNFDIQVNTASNGWNHIVTTTTEGGNTQIFVNGVLAATSAGTASISGLAEGNGNQNNDELWIGNNPDNAVGTGDRQWDGLIDDIAQWNRVLTADEVSTIFNEGIAGTSLGAITIPEPSSTALIGLGGLAFVLRRRR